MKAEPKADAAPPKSSKKLIIIIALAVVLLGGGGGGAWFFMHSKDDKSAHKEVKKAVPPVLVPMEPFTVNLQPENGDQFLQVAFTLQVSNEQQVELIKSNMARVRNRVLLLLSSKKASELSTPEGKSQLSSELMAAIRQPFVEKGEPQEVTDVLFTSFIIQ